MKPHKWAKEIKAWADGEEIEYKLIKTWVSCDENSPPQWLENIEYRIKPQPKEPQYLYVFQGKNQAWLSIHNHDMDNYLGKIKLEVDDD